jgi:alcohol dehydrogenase (NADP+)
MKYLNFRNGDQMPAIGLGTWKAAPGDVYKAVREAIKIGYRHFDCAHIYGNEDEIGTAFADAFKAGEIKREELWVTSKLWNNSHRKDQVEPALKVTLKNLQLDYLDLYLIHWPVALQEGIGFPASPADFIPIDQLPLTVTWSGMETVAKKGLTKHIGVSNFNIKNLKVISEGATIIPEANQLELHPYLQQNELLDYCKKNEIVVTGYSPLGSSDRPARLIKESDPTILENEVIKKIAAEKNCSPAQILLSWAVTRGTSAIPKSVNPKRLKENLESAAIELSTADLKSIADLDLNFRYINGETWASPGSPYSLDYLWGK